MRKKKQSIKKKCERAGYDGKKIFAGGKMLEHNGFCAQAKPQTD